MTSAAPTRFPTSATTFHLPGAAGVIEVACDDAEADAARTGTAIICHPHPQHGGTMHNKVVTIVARALRESGLATVRFNFRGVGESTGEFDDGRGEADDLGTVVEWVRKVHPDDALWLAGFSFGSAIALRSAKKLAAAALISVAPPVDHLDLTQIELPGCPWLIVQGEADEIVNPAAVFAWIDALPKTLVNPPIVVRMADTSHFFHRRLMDLRGVVKNAMKPFLPPLRSAG